MANEQQIIIEVGGDEYLIIGDCEIVSSMLNMCNTFTFEAPYKSFDGFPAYAGVECVLKIDDESVVDGFIDIVEAEYNNENGSRIITASGRDKTGDLVDCPFDFEPNEWKEITVQDAITNLITPFGIELSVDPTVQDRLTGQLETFKANEGEYVADMIIELCRNHGILPMSLGDGKLTLTQATETDVAVESLTSGSTIIWGKRISNNLNRYSSYSVKGQGIGTDNKALTDFVEPYGSQTDDVILRTRPFVIFADGPMDSGKCQSRAQWEACIRAGMSRAVIYRYDAFYEFVDQFLWKKNRLVDIVDEALEIEETRIIAEVKYILSGDSRYCELLCVAPETFTLGDPSSIVGPGD